MTRDVSTILTSDADYPSRDWLVVCFSDTPPLPQLDPTVDLMRHLCGVDSEYAAQAKQDGSPVIYMDYEQWVAGLVPEGNAALHVAYLGVLLDWFMVGTERFPAGTLVMGCRSLEDMTASPTRTTWMFCRG